MKRLLARENSEVLAQFAWSRLLVAFDFDGTLAPIAPHPEDAKMRARTRTLLATVCRRYPSAVISGRSQRDVSSRLRGIPVKHVVGNHGLEPGAGLNQFEKEVVLAAALLNRALAGTSGVDIEDKRYSLALHYRRSRNRQCARSAIYAAAAALPMPMRVVPGKLVVNLLPAHSSNKGDALLALRTAEQRDTALYVGDDVTDEDVFELDQPGRLLTVRVGESRASAAAYFLRDQREIDRLLAKLIALSENGVSS